MYSGKLNYKYLITFLFIFFASSYLYSNLPFIDHDTVIYRIIGRDIFETQSLPYTKTFDHKPIVTYYIYGFLNLILHSNLNLITSLACCLISALILCKGNLNSFFILSSGLICGSALYSYMSGNTEILMLPFISAYLYTFDRKGLPKFFVLGVLAAILFNINYLAAVIMMPVSLYMFFNNTFANIIKSIIYFLLGFLTASFFIFLPFIAWNQSILDYFNLQHQFLKSYSNAITFNSSKSLIKFTLLLLPSLAVFICFLKKDREFILYILLFLGTVLASFSSGHGYIHYLVPLSIPMSLMFLSSFNYKKTYTLLGVLPIILGLIYILIVSIPAIKSPKGPTYLLSDQGKKDLLHINQLAQIDNTSLNIKSSHIIYLFSKARNINKLVFPDHPDIFYGKDSEKYYIEQINKHPHLIMTEINMCQSNSNVCDLIKKNYNYDSTSHYDFGYDLYVRKK